MSKLKEILKEYYYVDWKDVDECVEKISKEIKEYYLGLLPTQTNPEKTYKEGWSFNEQVGYNQAIQEMKERIENE